MIREKVVRLKVVTQEGQAESLNRAFLWIFNARNNPLLNKLPLSIAFDVKTISLAAKFAGQ